MMRMDAVFMLGQRVGALFDHGLGLIVDRPLLLVKPLDLGGFFGHGFEQFDAFLFFGDDADGFLLAADGGGSCGAAIVIGGIDPEDNAASDGHGGKEACQIPFEGMFPGTCSIRYLERDGARFGLFD